MTERKILPDGGRVQLVRTPMARSRPKALSASDAYLLLWVQNDRLRVHLPETKLDLAEGDLVFVRPDHRYALQGRGEAPMVVALACAPDLISEIGGRHPTLAGQLFWANGALPDRRHLGIRALAALNHEALRLERSDCTDLSAEAFLLPVLARLLDTGPALPQEAPAWLVEACRRAQNPEVFRDGAAGFVRVAGRAHPHVSRMARKFLDQSPSDYINAIRMDYAAKRLTGSSDPLTEIADECGLSNMSHFHKLFRARFGTPPAQFRRQRQSGLLRPGP